MPRMEIARIGKLLSEEEGDGDGGGGGWFCVVDIMRLEIEW